MKNKNFKVKLNYPENISLNFIDKHIIFGKNKEKNFINKLKLKNYNSKYEIKKEEKKNYFIGYFYRDKKKIYKNTFKKIFKNFINGLIKKFKKKLILKFSHFPARLEINNNFLKIINFYGRKDPIKIKIKKGIDLDLKENIIEIRSCDLISLNNFYRLILEKIFSKIRKFDKRIFQDGIYELEDEEEN